MPIYIRPSYQNPGSVSVSKQRTYFGGCKADEAWLHAQYDHKFTTRSLSRCKREIVGTQKQQAE